MARIYWLTAFEHMPNLFKAAQQTTDRDELGLGF